MDIGEQHLASEASEDEQRQEADRQHAKHFLRTDDDLRELLSIESGRRMIRAELTAGHLSLDHDAVPDLWHSDHAYMSAMNAVRSRSLNLAWRLFRMTASRQLDLESLSLLFNTSEDDL